MSRKMFERSTEGILLMTTPRTYAALCVLNVVLLVCLLISGVMLHRVTAALKASTVTMNEQTAQLQKDAAAMSAANKTMDKAATILVECSNELARR